MSQESVISKLLKTLARLLREVADEPAAPGLAVGEAMAKAAEDLWLQDIQDPRDTSTIVKFFRDAGFGWHVDKYNGYRRGRGQDWCGHTASAIARRAAKLLDRQFDTRLHRLLASTGRLDNRHSESNWRAFGYDTPRVDPADIEPGDVVVVVTSGGKAWGDHITVAIERPANGQVRTIEGNASGTLPDGSQGRGVVKRYRKLKDVRRVYRLGEEHFRHA
jgi:hypothetical protein